MKFTFKELLRSLGIGLIIFFDNYFAKPCIWWRIGF